MDRGVVLKKGRERQTVEAWEAHGETTGSKVVPTSWTGRLGAVGCWGQWDGRGLERKGRVPLDFMPTTR